MEGFRSVLGGGLRRFAAPAAALALLAGAAWAQDGGAAIPVPEPPHAGGLSALGPENIGPQYSHDVDHLYRVILWLTTGAFVLTQGLLLFFLFRFRARPGGVAAWTHGNHRLEIIWTLVPGAILFWLALFQFSTWKDIKIARPDPKEGLVVQVMAKQFEWHFRYAGPDGKFDTDDDLLTLNYLHVPVDTKVTVQLRTQDVLHSFFLPNLRLKQDTVPGLTINQWFEARKTTEQARKERGIESFNFEIACAELCGLGHTRMKGYLVVHSKEGFFAWADKAYLEEPHEYGKNPDNLLNRFWPATENKLEDPWLRDNWPADLKAKWPPK
ncbi:MAG: cytochrome c oxidase subunit II [Planctomycetes bacterium]|nr:cytochrome c oxidase subunit II [Planctomycetota bacterium]